MAPKQGGKAAVIRSVPRKHPIDPAPALDLRKLVSDHHNLVEACVSESRSFLASFDPRRQYSIVAGRGLRPVLQRRWRQNSSSEDDSNSDSGFDREGDAFKIYRETDRGFIRRSLPTPIVACSWERLVGTPSWLWLRLWIWWGRGNLAQKVDKPTATRIPTISHESLLGRCRIAHLEGHTERTIEQRNRGQIDG